MTRKFLPPLQADTVYLVQDFDSFEYFGLPPRTGGDTRTLRLHLRNRTTLDLPVSAEGLRSLLGLLIQAFPQDALAEVRQMPWGKDAP